MGQLQIKVDVGTLILSWSSQGLLKRIDWNRGRDCEASKSNGNSLERSSVGESGALLLSESPPRAMVRLARDLERYFAGEGPLAEVPWVWIDTQDWSPFQRDIYSAITRIPYAETRTYAWAATQVRRGGACRAVGQALRRNPLPVLIPCHRVVGAESLGGFMGSEDPAQPELKLKKWLIDLESRFCNPMFPFASETGGLRWSSEV